jgi:transcriptional regulator with XRE-family HTH domain
MGTPDDIVVRYVEEAQSALARELRGLRKALRLSQGELANRLATPVTQQAVAGYETGAIVMSVPRLIEFCFALEVSPVAVAQRVFKPLRTVLDLRVLVAISRSELAPLREWAEVNHGRTIVFDAGVRDALIELSGLSGSELDAALAPALVQRPVG